VAASRELPGNYARFFRAFGHRIRGLRMERKLSQEDMYSHGFSVRHWQMIEAGRPLTMFTMLRICEAFNVRPDQLIAGLGQYLRKQKPD
jgi:transcriptional regulator with XRE-family HTH domain